MTVKSLYINDIWLLLAFNYAKSVTQYVSIIAGLVFGLPQSPCLSYVMAVLSDCVISGARETEFPMVSLSGEIRYALQQRSVQQTLLAAFRVLLPRDQVMVEWLPHDLSTLASPDEWSERIKIWLSVKQKTEWKEIAEPYHRNVWETSVELLLNELMKSCLCSAARWSA